MENELYHHGIKGMKWGIRRFQNADGSLTKAGKKRYGDEEGDSSEEKKTSTKPAKVKPVPEHLSKKKVKSMTTEELKERINRLTLENDLRKLEKSVYPTKGKDFVFKVLEKSGENISTQLTTYAMGAATNKILQEVFGNVDSKFKNYEFVNPKKGQKKD